MMPPKNTPPSISNAVTEAQSIVDAAEKRAELIIHEAKGSADKVRKEAYQEGYQDGHSHAISTTVRHLKDHSVLKRKIASEAAGLAYQILEKVFHLNAPEILEPIQHLAKRLISSITIGKKIDLIIHPSNRHTIASLENELTELARDSDFYVVEVKDMPKDTIMVRTDFGEIQVSLSGLLSEINTQVRLKDNLNEN
jgi:flagellar biosynthesis/type III secretory pathway protein FliH